MIISRFINSSLNYCGSLNVIGSHNLTGSGLLGGVALLEWVCLVGGSVGTSFEVSYSQGIIECVSRLLLPARRRALSSSSSTCLPARHHAPRHDDSGLNLSTVSEPPQLTYKICCGHGVSAQN